MSNSNKGAVQRSLGEIHRQDVGRQEFQARAEQRRAKRQAWQYRVSETKAARRAR
jgi:hypothetical protein